MMEEKDRERKAEDSVGTPKGILEEVFGPSDIPPLRYRCPEHGVFLGTQILWKRDGQPYCPTCGQPVEELAGEG